MEVATLISTLSGISSILGYNVKDFIKKKSDSQKEDLVKGVVGVLSIFEQSDDPLVGVWEINQWDYEYEGHSHFYVFGRMAILYRDPSDSIWKGAISLRYQKELSSKPYRRADGWVARRRGHSIDTVHNVHIWIDSTNKFSGTATQVYRSPERGFFDAAELKSLKLSEGKLEGEFVNTNSRGSAKIAFHQRKRWKELLSKNFIP